MIVRLRAEKPPSKLMLASFTPTFLGTASGTPEACTELGDMLRPLLALMMADTAASLHAAAALRTARAPTTMPQAAMSAAFQDRRSVLCAASAAAIFSMALPASAVAGARRQRPRSKACSTTPSIPTVTGSFSAMPATKGP